ncbi:uncharacterized protein SPSK_09155 [Sporothrix schenckii 1099-18]|uniref:Uncharacterized protein n=1 Tax=Sporothrix schenckii 1099-18 TaxID=1397361 RepID=A0A0F2M995_SPOSC|nr:uncharacterized protein SPSK_09155 [Sporothrix schenckii 1099-18]KJR84731.1 hypothetical protein SPSK_09155 [Sporothrix schenckii 1099-18]
MAVISPLGFCTPLSPSRHFWTYFTVVIAAAILASGVRADCYWPDGTENDEHQPCYSPNGGAIGLCCGTGDVCLSNGVCMSRSSAGGSTDMIDSAYASNLDTSVYYRGSCTFKDWSQDKNCPTVCIKGSGISPHTDVGIIPCPGSNTDWYCADGNMHKANCSTGAFIVSLPRPVSFTTIGISPSKTAHTVAPTSASTSTATSMTSSPSGGNATTGLVTAPGTTAPTGFSSGVSGPSVASTTSGNPLSTMDPPPTSSPSSNSGSNVPLAVGVTIGGASIIAAAVIGYFLWRRRKRDEPAPAESPPPRDVPDDVILNSVLEGSMFRSGSLLSRRPSKTLLSNMGAGDGGPAAPMPDTRSVLSGPCAESLRSGSMLSSFQQYQQSQQQQQQQQQQPLFQQQPQAPLHLHQPHPQRHYSYAQARFSSDAVAMHDLRRTPPVAWGHQGSGPSVTSEPIPEIPYDDRRMAAYHGVPTMEHNNYSELPG